jgi:hypothetical protein
MKARLNTFPQIAACRLCVGTWTPDYDQAWKRYGIPPVRLEQAPAYCMDTQEDRDRQHPLWSAYQELLAQQTVEADAILAMDLRNGSAVLPSDWARMRTHEKLSFAQFVEWMDELNDLRGELGASE